MTFYSGTTDMDTLIDLIADQLIATGAWATADASLVTGQHPAKRAVKHLTDANFYVTLSRDVLTFTYTTVNEIQVQISTGFDTVAHNASGTIQVTGIPTEGAGYGQTAVAANNKAGTHYTWIDASGVTLLSTWAPGTHYDFTVFFTLERNASKEYADGYSNFFCASIPNVNNQFSNYNFSAGYYSTQANRAFIVRPFNYQEYADQNNGLATFFGGYRSPGNSKVYFEFPFFSNNQNQQQRSPIAQTQRFFQVQPGQGLSDGDLVTYVSGANTFTYLVKTLQSPEATQYAAWAIRQA